MSDAPEIAALVDEHWPSWATGVSRLWDAQEFDACGCGHIGNWRVHLASVLEAHTVDRERAAAEKAWDEGVDAAFRGAITRQNASDVKSRNPYSCTCPHDEFLSPSDCRLHGEQVTTQPWFSNGEETDVPDNLRRTDKEADQ